MSMRAAIALLITKIEGVSMTTAIATPNDTNPQLPAVKAEESERVPALAFPQHYIIARAPQTKGEQIKAYKAIQRGEAIPGQCLAVYHLETAPDRAFEAWLLSCYTEHKISDLTLIAKLGSLNWIRWPLKDRYAAINLLAEYLEGRATLPLYESKEAAQAAMAGIEAGESADASTESEAANERP
jgi:hypothetical protein